MRVAVVNLTRGGMSGGYRKYLIEVIPRLAADPRVSQIRVFTPAGASGLTGVDERPLDSALSQSNAFSEFDVVFVPTARTLRVGRRPLVTMVRNMEPMQAPFGGNSIREGLINLARATIARRSCRQATRVIAVSEHVRAGLRASGGQERNTVGVTPGHRSTIESAQPHDPVLHTEFHR